MRYISLHTTSPEETMKLGFALGQVLQGGEVLQLVSDVGGGKTTFVKGVAEGMGSDETVQSPTFIISALYECSDNKRLYHYDFYRLEDAGLMNEQLVDSLNDPLAVTIIEWGNIVKDVIQRPVVTVKIIARGEQERTLDFDIPDEYEHIGGSLKELVL